MRKLSLAAGLLFLLGACQPAVENPLTEESIPSATLQGLSTPGRPLQIPSVDTSQHSVPLDQIYFDTFNPANRAVPLDQASQDLIESLIDAIPPIHNPVYEPGSNAEWLVDDDMVLGYSAGGEAWAYPIRILNFHEIVNDELSGEPVLISYCPLCYSGIVYSRRFDDGVLAFGNTSALYDSDMVMLDYQTGSYWWQVAGEAIVGPLTGEQLEVLPSTVTTWKTWRELHPNTSVLSRDTGYSRNYDQDPFARYPEFVNSGQFAFPVGEAARDLRLSPAATVLALNIEDETVAYQLEMDKPTVIHDEVGNEPVVIFIDPNSRAGFAYSPIASGELLRFTWTGNGPQDENTESLWDLSGKAVDGPLSGKQLESLPTKTTFWFAVVAAEPDIEVRLGD